MASDTESLVLSISADTRQISRALKRLEADTKQSASAISKSFDTVGRTDPVGKMQQNLSRSMGAIQADAKNLTFQLNDIATSLAGGQSPFQVMMQQSSQVSQVLTGAGGLKAGITALGSAFAGLVSPVGLATSAIILGIGYAVQYFTATEDGADDANKELKKHADTLDAILSKYGDLAPEAKRVLTAMQEAAKSADAIKELDATLAGMRVDAVAKLKAELEGIRGVSNDMKRALADAFGRQGGAKVLEELTADFEALIATIQKGEDPTERAEALLRKLNALHMQAPGAGFERIYNTIQNILPLGEQLVDQQQQVLDLQNKISNAAEKTKLAFEGLAGPLGPLIEALRQIAPTLDQLLAAPGKLMTFGSTMSDMAADAVTATPSAAKTFLKTKAASEKIAERMDLYDDAYATALAKLFTILPPTARISSGPRTHAEQQDIRDRGIRPAAPAGRSHHEQRGDLRPQAADISGVSPEVLKAAVDQIKELETLKGKTYERDKMHVQLAGTQARMEKAAADEASRAADEANRIAEQKAEQQKRAHETLLDHITALDEEATLQERVNQINSDAALTGDQKTVAIRVETELQKALNQAKADGIKLTDAEILKIREKAATAAATKIVATDLTQKTKESAQLAQQISQTAQTAVGGLVNDLRNGVEAGEAFNNMLQRILDSVIQMTLQSLFNPVSAGGGGLGDFIGKLFGVAHSGGIVGSTAFPTRKVSPLVFAGAQRFASGGMVGLRSGEVPIVAHKGEMVIPKNMVGKGGGSTVINNNQSTGPIAIDMSATGLVAADSESGRQFGQNVQKIIQAEMVRQSRPGGLLRKVPT